MAIGVLPLEALLLLLLLAGSDPGPLPQLERLLCWSIGALAPAVLLWRRPADVWSLLLVQTPERALRQLQRRLSDLQRHPLCRYGVALGAVLVLPLLWWIDGRAAVAGSFSPVAGTPRLVSLLLSAGLLAVMVWQWQQLLQALWLLGRSAAEVDAASPMDQQQLAKERLSLGIPLLLLEPLRWEVQDVPPQAPSAAPAPQEVEGDGKAPAETSTYELHGPIPPGETPLRQEAGIYGDAPPTAGEPNAADPQPHQGGLLTGEAVEPVPVEAKNGRADGKPVDQQELTDQSQAASGVFPGMPGAVEPEQPDEKGEGDELDEQVG